MTEIPFQLTFFCPSEEENSLNDKCKEVVRPKLKSFSKIIGSFFNVVNQLVCNSSFEIQLLFLWISFYSFTEIINCLLMTFNQLKYLSKSHVGFDIIWIDFDYFFIIFYGQAKIECFRVYFAS